MNLKLRQCLKQITRDEQDVWKHIELVEALRPEHRHSIHAVKPQGQGQVHRYKCAVYAFDLVQDPTYIKIATYDSSEAYAGTEFVEYVLNNGLLTKLAESSQEPGDLAIYFENKKVKHIGKVKSDNRIISKWGRGLLWEHDIFEVPADYGNEKRFYAQPSTCTGLDLFCEYARTQGFDPECGDT